MGESMRVVGSEIHHRGDTLDNRPEMLIWFENKAGHVDLHTGLKNDMDEAKTLANLKHKFEVFDPKLKKAIAKWTK